MQVREKGILVAIAVVVVAALAAVYGSQFTASELTVLNPNPYRVLAAVRYEKSAGIWVTEGWFELGPGERKTVSVWFYRIAPNFFAYAESNDGALIRWLPNNLAPDQPAKVFFDTEDGIPVSLPKDRSLDPSENSEVEEFNFSRVKIADGDPLHILVDSLFEDVMLNEYAVKSESSDQFFLNIEKHAKSLSESLARQMEFDKRFPNPESSFPFLFEFAMADEPAEDGFLLPGVRLTEVDGLTLFGDEIQLRSGDLLVAVNDVEVFAPADAYVELYRHAMNEGNGGITVPVKYVIVRGDEVLAIESNYLFNPRFPWTETREDAFLYNLGNSATLGFLAEIKGFFSEDYDESRWDTVQKLGRFRQFFPEQSFAGEIAGFFLPSPLTILKLGKAAKGARAAQLAGTALKVTAIELAEVAIYSYKTASPNRTQTDIIKDISIMAVPTAVIGLVSARFASGTKPTLARKAPKPFRRTRR